MALKGPRDGERAAVAPFCVECGTDLHEAKFCPECGMPAAGDHETVKLGPFDRHQANTQHASDSVRTGAIAPVRADAGAAATSSDAGRRGPRRGVLVGAVAVGLVVIAGAIAAVFLTSSSGTSPNNQASTVYGQKLAAAFEPVVADNRALSDSLASLHGKDASAAQRATARAQSAASAAQGALNALTAPSNSQQLASQARQALDREQAYLTAVAVSLANPASSGVSQTQSLAANLTAAFDAVGSPLNGASQSVGGADTLTTWAQRTAAHDAAARLQAAQQQAPVAPAPLAQAPTGLNPCDPNISAGPSTTCPFAENVFAAYAANYKANGEQGDVVVNAFSSSANQSYDMNCATDGVTVNCSGGNNAFVTFPMHAVVVY